MKKLRTWLLETFLPAWAKDSVYKENADLKCRISELEAEKARLNAYIDGLEAGVRAQRKIVIKNEVAK